MNVMTIYLPELEKELLQKKRFQKRRHQSCEKHPIIEYFFENRFSYFSKYEQQIYQVIEKQLKKINSLEELNIDTLRFQLLNSTLVFPIDEIIYPFNFEENIKGLFKKREIEILSFTLTTKDNQKQDFSFQEILTILTYNSHELEEFFTHHSKKNFYAMLQQLESNLFHYNEFQQFKETSDYNYYVFKEKFLQDEIWYLQDGVIRLNEDFTNKVLGAIPTNSTSFEKQLFIFFYLCNALVYDLYYYAFLNGIEIPKYQTRINHYDIQYLSDISLVNNQINCNEFSIVFALLCKKIGIDSSTNILGRKIFMNQKHFYFKDTHVSAICFDDELHLSVHYDAFQGIIDGLMSIVKNDLDRIQLDFEHLSHHNSSISFSYLGPEAEKTMILKQMQISLEKVKQDIQRIFPANHHIEKINEYILSLEDFDFAWRKNIFLRRCVELNLQNFESYFQLLDLRRLLFSSRNHFEFHLIPSFSQSMLMMNAVIQIEENQQMKYYVINENNKINPTLDFSTYLVTQEELSQIIGENQVRTKLRNWKL